MDVVESRLVAAGYRLFPKLVDAAWYGVPQNRARFFLMGLHRDLGYEEDQFGDQGPFPAPTHGSKLQPAVTVREAISDLPPIGNGCVVEAALLLQPVRANRRQRIPALCTRGVGRWSHLRPCYLKTR